MRYTKEDVEFHREGYYGKSYPAVNVKVHNLISIYEIVDKFSCSETQAEKALIIVEIETP